MPKGDYDPQGFTDHELKQYAEITFRNRVQFYTKALFQLLNGEHAQHLLTKLANYDEAPELASSMKPDVPSTRAYSER
ncbi:hypothetical protein AC480_01385 [miscellaneous Crenarchaeota group archaeon SMTZ1-55]|nr:MAG: hypothetical protein AC480_01385 [miscellaneous Crenarchaeota group archaeon SMTZ1-55]